MNSWIDPHRVVSAEPLPRDHVVVTYVEGRRVAVNLAREYERIRDAAVTLAKQIKRPVKVLPMTIVEFMGFMGTDPREVFAGVSPDEEDQGGRLAIAACIETLRECGDAAVRKEAFDLLIDMGGSIRLPA